MTGYDIFTRAMNLLGYTDYSGKINNDAGVVARALYAVNQIGDDLCQLPPLNNLMEKLSMDGLYAEAMVYGVAMMISLSENDGTKNSIFTELYNGKRAAAKSGKGVIADVLPCAYDM